MMSQISGETVEVANGHLSFEIYDVSANMLSVITDLLVDAHGFTAGDESVIGLDEVVTELSKGGVKLGLGWDNWTGAYLMAFCKDGDKLLGEVSQSLSDELAKPEYSRYIDHRGVA